MKNATIKFLLPNASGQPRRTGVGALLLQLCNQRHHLLLRHSAAHRERRPRGPA